MATARRHKKPIVLKSHHRKAYRKRQLASLALAVLFLVVLVLQTGIMIGRTQPGALPVSTTETQNKELSSIRSSYGFSFEIDANAFDVSATLLKDDGTALEASQEQLRSEQPLTSAFIKPRPGSVQRLESVSQLSIQIDPSATDYAEARNNPVNSALSAAQVAAQFFPITSTNELDVSELSSRAETLNSVPVQKTVYQYTPKFNGGVSYAIVWTGVSEGRAFAVKLQGLVGASTVPSTYQAVFTSLKFNGDQSVQGVSTSIKNLFGQSTDELPPVENRYLSDAFSPAVVKIYHATCGTLLLYGQQLGEATCVGSTGSGFFMTSDGYIATNGHVVSYSAQDALVDALLTSPDIFASFLVQAAGMTPAEASQVLGDPSLMASAIIKIYNIPKSELSFANEQSVTMVATGTLPPDIQGLVSGTDLSRFKRETRSLKQAEIVATNYLAQDVYTAIVDPNAGFSASDVAILKVDTDDAPTIPLGASGVRQNEKIIIAGFPGDADNVLTDNTELSVSITNGAISSIRKAAGSNANLYQSDADASHGNSGGPAINEDGYVVGLLTYRFDDGGEGNAAKSYIRDIDDVRRLAQKNKISIDNFSTTQRAWQRGLASYSTNHYSKALRDFKIVNENFPSHRLVANYMGLSRQAIADGKDVKDFPISILLAGIVVMLIVVGTSLFMIIRHHGHHKVYQAYHSAGTIH